jgi:hypothetical protein
MRIREREWFDDPIDDDLAIRHLVMRFEDRGEHQEVGLRVAHRRPGREQHRLVGE